MLREESARGWGVDAEQVGDGRLWPVLTLVERYCSNSLRSSYGPAYVGPSARTSQHRDPMTRTLPKPRPLRRSLPILSLLVLAGIIACGRSAAAIDLILPTSNDALLRGDDSAFYMHTAASREQSWNSGKFGFVRNPRSTREGTIHMRHHAGIDIRPLYRDRQGKPLDSVRAVSDGVVVYTNDTAGHSNYGKYVVVEHLWGGSRYYSLYAHLGEVWVDSGAAIAQGALLGRLGYTGDGINRERAHLHFEINLLINERFDAWFPTVYRGDANHHGSFNGLNLMAIDVGRLYLALKDDPGLTIPEFVAEETPFYTVTVPRGTVIDMARRYPWLVTAEAGEEHRSWTIYFAQHGLPLKIEPSLESVDRPRPFVIQISKLPYRWLTKSIIAGHGENYSLSNEGERLIGLMTAQPELRADVPAKK
jgi:murein DD-endopeptidase MepM/ murein hydrolase activator NlpD